MTDRVGLGWRPELAAGIMAHVDRIDVLEVVAETCMADDRRARANLRALGRERPLIVHGVSLGLASSLPVDRRRLDRMARLVADLQPDAWSEHLAFVRAAGVEIGHMALPPRCPLTIEGAIANVARATAVVGARPALENVASLLEPPGSSRDEGAWVSAIVRGSGAAMVLDLHNLYANAVNAGRDPLRLLGAMPLDRVEQVHLSGGVWIAAPDGRERRLLDDHLHDVPDTVYGLLAVLASRVDRPLTVIIERDGGYPAFERLLAQIERARAVLAQARAQPLRAA